MKICKLLLSAALLLPLFSCSSPIPAPTEVKVMSFNMRYDRPDEGDNNWIPRRERIVQLVMQQDPDLLGTQELLHHQYRYIDSMLTEYASVGVAREDGLEEGEYNALFFKRDRFTVLDSGTFWLSATPDVAGSQGWDGACKRIATWALLREEATGRELLAINTHLDHVGKKARRKGILLLSERIEQLREGRPVILTGDFNATPDSKPIQLLLAQGRLVHTRDVAESVEGPLWSFTDFGQIPEEERPLIDYIFTGGCRTIRYERLPDTVDGGLVSDHAPVFALVELN